MIRAAVVLVLVVLVVLVAIPSARAFELVNTPTIDGSCSTTASEYDGANTITNANLTIRHGTRDDTRFAYICVIVTADTTNDTFADLGEIVFDTDHGHETTPQSEDRLFNLEANNPPFLTAKGDGTTWIDCGVSCDPGDTVSSAFVSGKQNYEFKIRYSDVWSTLFPIVGQTAGFAVLVMDATSGGIFSFPVGLVDDMNPSVWDHIVYFGPVIPAAQSTSFIVWILMFVLISGAFFVSRRRRGIDDR